MSPGRLPDAIGIVPAFSQSDYNSLNVARAGGVYKLSAELRTAFTSIPPQSGDEFHYVVAVKTGGKSDAATSDKMFLTLQGTKGTSELFELQSPGRGRFKRNSEDVFTLCAPDIGEITCLHLEKKGTNPWFCEYIKVFCQHDQSRVFFFPGYRWVESRPVILFDVNYGLGSADLKRTDTHESARTWHLNEQRERFPWNEDPEDTLPLHCPFINFMVDLPKDCQFDSGRIVSIGLHELELQFNANIKDLKNKFKNLLNLKPKKDQNECFESLEEIDKIFSEHSIEFPSVASRWKTDEEFADSMLHGSHPYNLIQVVDGIPDSLFLNDATVEGLLPPGTGLLGEIAAGRVYYSSHEILDGIKTFNQSKDFCDRHALSPGERFVSPSQGLFHVRQSDGRLMPLAIQLRHEPGSPVWTPKDDEIEWLTAKTYFKVAQMNVHQMEGHLFSAHLVMEAFIISLFRNVASCHPIYKLLHHHSAGVLAINTFGRAVLISGGGLADKILSVGGGGHIDLLRKSYHRWDYRDHCFPNMLMRRGLNDKTKLPRYFFRDDGLLIWDAIKKYVTSILALHYKDDQTLVGDNEAQNWIKDVHDNGLRAAQNVPEKFTTIDELIDCVTGVIFTVTCGHASLNYSQFSHMGYVPNFPGSALLPAPMEKGEASLKRLVASLPTQAICSQQMITTSTLSEFYDSDTFLGDYPDQIFHEKELEVVQVFQGRIAEISNTIQKRNSLGSKVPLVASGDTYQVLDPSRVPNGIGI